MKRTGRNEPATANKSDCANRYKSLVKTVMTSREKILSGVRKNQPPPEALPSLQAIDAIHFENIQQQFTMVLESIGGVLLTADNLQQVAKYVNINFPDGNKFITTIPGLQGIQQIVHEDIAHALEDVEVSVINGAFGIAENAAIWITGSSVKTRVLPFICQHLVVILDPEEIVHNMHEAYDKIGYDQYEYGVFIAGPSKTADIEQSLVLGAHGARTMSVFLVPSS